MISWMFDMFKYDFFCNSVQQYIPYLRGECNMELCGNVVSNCTDG